MAITVVKNDTEGVPYLMFDTFLLEGEVDTEENPIEMWVAVLKPVDQELKVIGESIKYEIPDEKEFHVKLRFESDAAGKLERKFCSNPEWNPEKYIKDL